jgi:hypothetical protein
MSGDGAGLLASSEAAGISAVPMTTGLELLDGGFSGRHLLGVAAEAVRHAEALELIAVRQARAEGVSWTQIGDLLGVTKQSAHQRFSRRV